MRLSWFIALCCFGIAIGAKASVTHQLFRKVAVFPIADANFSTAEDAWWQVREVLTKEQRFLVASRRFMINRGVFQPRRLLKPADAIILGKILDAEALMTVRLQDRNLKMSVYSGETGAVLWESSLELHPALPIADQLIKASQKLAQDFLMAIPYQGFQIVDEVVGKPVFEIDGQKHAWIFHGVNSGLEPGDPVQWLEIRGNLGETFFNSNLDVQVIAEGKVLQVRDNQAEVLIEKTRSLEDLKENSLVRFPREMSRLKNQYAGQDRESALTTEYLNSELKTPADLEKGHHPTSVALAFLGNIALIVLLAF